MLDRIVNILSAAFFSLILFALAYLIVDDYICLHQRIDALEQTIQEEPIELIIPLPNSSTLDLNMEA